MKKTEKEVQLRSKFLYCDSTIFDVFTLPFIQGEPKAALRDPFSVVIKESTARVIFGNQDPIGETLDIFHQAPSTRSYTLTGVIQDPENFHIDFDILLSIVSINEQDRIKPYGREIRLNSYQLSYFTYLLLPHPHDKTRTENNINAFFSDKMKDASIYSEGAEFSLRPLKEIYFSNPPKNERGISLYGNLKLLKILMAIAAIILVLACINYINLTTARSSLRAREVGVRKVVGSRKSRLMFQFLAESVLISLVSFLLAITIVQVLLPSFNQITELELSIERLFQPQTILFTSVVILMIGIMAGIYPAIYMTTFQPVASLKGELQTGLKSVLLRRILLTFQFTISVVLMIGVFTILRQVKYMKTADLGFDKEFVVNITLAGLNRFSQEENRQVFKESLLKHPNIKKVAYGEVPGRTRYELNRYIEHNGYLIKPNWSSVEPAYFDLLDVKILDGRNFSWDSEADYRPGEGLPRIVINETAMREFELESPVGAVLNPEYGSRLEIIGIVEDFHFFSLHNIIEPTIYFWYGDLRGVSIKILPHDIPGTLRFIKKEYESMFPDNTFEYSFLDETFDQQYESDERLTLIISNFAIVALLIGCLGLFGLSFFMAARKTKEIGIRKANGASDMKIFILLCKEFIKWVTLAVLIACPMGWIIMNKWLQNFAYRTNIGIGIFILAILIAFAISFITVAWHAWKTARTNPIEALRYE